MTYNRFHDPDESAADIQKLRALYVETLNTVTAAYGWSDLDLKHDFHETKQGIRFTISESARREVLHRLLKLNHERYAEEVKLGLHEKKGKAKLAATRRGRKTKSPTATRSFLDEEHDPDPDPPVSPSTGNAARVTSSDEDVWYFAYGSNLSVDRKRERTGDIRQAIPARLDGYRFAFNKRASREQDGAYANIMADPSGQVWGAAYFCNPQAIRLLDVYEGVAAGHYKHVPVEVTASTGEAISAMAYVAEPAHIIHDARPSEDYLRRILDGARHHGLPEDYIRTIEAEARASKPPIADPPARPTPIDEIDTDDIMAAFRQAARNRGWIERDELLKEVSLVLGYQRLGPRIDEALRGHLRAAFRRRIIETESASLVRAGAVSMADYEPDELVEVFRSVMRKGTSYDREEVIPALARHLGFVRLTDSIREPIRKAITRALRQGLLGYEGSIIWRL